ncbi:MAG TPA: hypothetical protein VGS20_17715, partial [Candidatus Acidoferrales bacterium]|nr:hypothetical protein [Candidatus Acidoferrales bacterium]
RWQALNLNLPPVPVHDLAVKGDDLVIATHGRAFWSLDDISSLRQLTAAVQNEPAHLFKPAGAYRAEISGGGFFGGAAMGADIDYWLKSAPTGEVTLQIFDGQGKLVRSYSSKDTGLPPGIPAEFAAFFHPVTPTKNVGMNRLVWDLRYQAPRAVPGAIAWGGLPFGPTVAPGTYVVKLTVGGQTSPTAVEVKEDPRVQVTQADLEKQTALALQIQDAVNAAHDAVNQIRSLHEQLEAAESRLGGAHQDLADAAKQVDREAVAIEDRLIQTKSKTSEDPLNFPIMLADQMQALGSTIESAEGAPTDASVTTFNQLKAQIDLQLAAWSDLQKKDLPALNERMKRANVPFVSVAPTPAPASTPM